MTETKIKNLALGGGGIFGYAEVGALTELEKYADYLQIESICGTSVGSIISTLYAIGYTNAEMYDIIFSLDFATLIQDSYIPYINLYTKYGMYAAKKLEDKIEELVTQKTNIKNCTFSQVDMNLTIVATNINQQKPYFFNKTNTPMMIISKAIRMSISYPIIMMPVLYDDDYWGDGGEFLNYPITIFDNMEETIGITFAAHNENKDGTLKIRTNIDTNSEYIKSLASTMSRSAYISQITPAHLNRSIIIEITENVTSMEFNIPMDKKKLIYECGVNAVRDQINDIIGVTTDKNNI
uniref:PNPLA domain-containing protein n=1 Tax=viral metagenome TaxID=1070528 RepID=A0A6C0CAG8_9ZZZZ